MNASIVGKEPASASAAWWRLAVLFLGVVMLSNLGLRGMRLDLTQNRLYTLSPGTKQVLAELKEPVNLYFYFSRDAAEKQSPLIMPYANRVREFLEEITARSGGKIRLQRHRSAALLGGRGPRRRGRTAGAAGRRRGGESLYFGLAGTNSTDGRAVDPELPARPRGIPGIRRGEAHPGAGDAEETGRWAC